MNLEAFRDYSLDNLKKDVLSGIVVGIIAIPLGLGFAIASGTTPVTGLYTTIVAGLLISIFGGLILSIVSSILVILYKFFEWQIVEVLTPFLMPLLWLLVFGFFFVITVRTLTNLFKYKWKPFAIQTVTILLWLFFPFTQIVLDIDFKMNKPEREEVVGMVNSGTLKPNVSYDGSLIHLPEKYDQLSKGGGEIVVEKNGDSYTILFFTFRGILDSFSGFVYSPNDQRPSRNDFDGDFKEIERLDKNWYWVASY